MSVKIDVRNYGIDYLEEKDLWDVEELLEKFKDLEVEKNSIYEKYEDKDTEVVMLKEELSDFRQNVEDNYELISPYKLYGISESDFH